MRAAAAFLAVLSFAVPACARGAPDVDPRFRMTLPELEKAAAGLAPGIRARIREEPGRFLALMHGTLGLPGDLLLLVDKKHGLPHDYVPSDLSGLAGTGLLTTREGLSLRSAVLPDLLAMKDAARAQGCDLPVSSTYRSYEYQVTIYKRELKTRTREEVERELAPPGHSQHQLGTAIDFGSITADFADTAAGKWLLRNAWRFGFSLSYPRGLEAETGYAWEPWHYRYVGKSAAALIESFFGGRQQAFLAFTRDRGTFFRERLRK